MIWIVPAFPGSRGTPPRKLISGKAGTIRFVDIKTHRRSQNPAERTLTPFVVNSLIRTDAYSSLDNGLLAIDDIDTLCQWMQALSALHYQLAVDGVDIVNRLAVSIDALDGCCHTDFRRCRL